MIKSVYIHIPFCEDICTYCDFCKFYYNEERVDKYLIGLKDEVLSKYNNEKIETIYIGGGTPSSLNIKQLEYLMSIITIFNRDNLVEFTFECNVENITEEKAQLLSKYGVNRISVGVQTLNNKYISFLNRHHNKNMVMDKITMLKKYFDNISIDLIYAIPGESIQELKDDIESVINLGINHLSTYSLILEEHTILYNKHIESIDDELDYNMYDTIRTITSLNNLNQYEISNFGKPSKHNLTYWLNEEYYGFGLSASGYIGNTRYTNTRNLNKYLNKEYIYTSEELTINEIIENEFILGLRLIKGIDINKLKTKYNLDIKKVDFIIDLVDNNKLEIVDNYLRINSNYLYVSNDILINFIGVDYGQYI
jgi:oxygen-independent coproporphyrinogen-3 oxidase